MFQHILVPLDGSSRAERALPVAAHIARVTGGSLLLMQVVNPPIDYSGGLAPVPLMSEQVIESEMAEATEYLKAVAIRMPTSIKTTTEVLFGIPAHCILATSASRGVDLIVLCSHGRTGFARWALGSVAHTLAHESTVPTLVLRESELASMLAGPDTMRSLCALVPLDGSELAETALAPAAHLVAALAAPAKAALHLAHVVKPFHEAPEEGLEDEARERARAYLAHVTERLQKTTQDLRLSITWSVTREKDVASALVSLAEQGGAGKETGGMGSCDLIAISTHGRNGLERWVMGSVTDRLLSATKLPLLIVRPPKQA
jgi:nucleotide-binding universal stress UspA family protein